MITMKISLVPCPMNVLSHLHVSCIDLSQRPMKLNARVPVGQWRPQSIYLHTSTGLVVERLSAGHILVSLKSLLHQTWVNGLLMDIKKQVLFLLAGALHKKQKATPWLEAVVLTKHFVVWGHTRGQILFKDLALKTTCENIDIPSHLWLDMWHINVAVNDIITCCNVVLTGSGHSLLWPDYYFQQLFIYFVFLKNHFLRQLL